MTTAADWTSELKGLLPKGSVIDSAADLAAYSYDGALERARPEAVVLAGSASDVRRTVLFCSERKIPFTARGAGTNLSGGAIPLQGGVVLSLARMNRILGIDTPGGFAWVEPGVVNGVLQKELEKVGFFYAPDPASLKVSTIGGNIAENAGGPRCLKYGTTTNHVLAVEAVMPDGTLERFSASDAGPEIMSLLVGSEGTLGVVAKAKLRILPIPERTRVILAGFPSINAAIDCVAASIAKGIIPRALEAMDKTTVDSIEGYMHAGYPKAEAVLLIELDGTREDVEKESAAVETLLKEFGAFDLRAAEDPSERDRLWEGRRGAYAAVARIAPNVLVEDGVVPRNRLPEIVRRIQQVARDKNILAALLFHAGDGNIHPNIAYDERDAEETARVKAAGFEILEACVELGGSLSGEHGIGSDKRAAMAWLFAPEALSVFRKIKNAFDPKGIANPDKVIPFPEEEKGGSLLKSSERPLSDYAKLLTEKIMLCAKERRPMIIRGTGSKTGARGEGAGESFQDSSINASPLAPRPSPLVLETAGLSKIIEIDRGNLTLTVEAGISMRELILELKRQGLYLRLPEIAGTLGGLLATKTAPNARDEILGMRLLLSDGSVASFGGKVVKNVAGYDVPKLILGSWGAYGLILETTLRLYARPQSVPPPGAPLPFKAGAWTDKLKRAFDPENLFDSRF